MLRKYFTPSIFYYNKLLCKYISCGSNTKSCIHIQSRSNYVAILQKQICKSHKINRIQPQKNYSKRLIEDLFNKSNSHHEKDIFSNPRVTLNELAAVVPEKIFEISFKQTSVSPKGSKKKQIQNDWICTYTFAWPEKKKFENTAISKRQAAEKSATQALQWLYNEKRIDLRGKPIYDQSVLKELQDTLNTPIHAEISNNSLERLNRIWDDYERDIKHIYEGTFSKAKHLVNISTIMKDSTIDGTDFSDDIPEQENVFDDITDTKIKIHPVFGKPINPTPQALARRERTIRQTFLNYEEQLSPLPIDQYADEITSSLERSRALVLVGAAGCGKSTRAPAALLRRLGGGLRAVVAEPRRVAAVALARRVAAELREQIGESIGYQVRLQSRPPRPPGGAILYCTSGVLLRRLQSNPGLEGCTHVFIDEAHERDVNTDVTLLLLRRAMEINPHLKVVLMSATLDTQVFTRYFNECPVIQVPGRTFPVEISHLEDIERKFNLKLPSSLENCSRVGKPQINCQEIVEVIKSIDKNSPEGAILVFLPGWAEIQKTKNILEEHYKNSSLHTILPLHSRLSTTDQTKIFSTFMGIRKIVLATNIAETSITIPDVVHVIDSGTQRENRLREATNICSLETVWASRASCTQRAGRAGRVRAGHCYKMYTKEKEAEFQPHSTPEILRVPLEQTVLDCKSYAPNDNVVSFLSQLPEPPSLTALQLAIDDLVDLGALTPSQQLSRVGAYLSGLALAPRAGRGLLLAAVLGAAGGSARAAAPGDVFRDAGDRREDIREIKRSFSPSSDHAALYHLQEEFERSDNKEEFCERYGLRRDRLQYVKAITNQHLQQILKTGIIDPTADVSDVNRFSDIDALTAAILLSGSNSLMVTKKHIKSKGKLMTASSLFTSKGEKAHVSSDSVNHGITKRKHTTQLLTYLGGLHSTDRRALVVHMSSVVTPHTVILFSLGDITKNISDGSNDVTELFLPRHKLKIQVPTSQVDAILKAREMLSNTFQYYIERDLRDANFEDITEVSRFKIRLVKAICKILVEADDQNVHNNNK